METIADFIQRAADRTGFVREKYIEKDIPTSYANLMVIMFFGDQSSEFILSSLLMQRFQKLHSSKYIILCGLPKHSAMFPSVNEYWSIKDEAIIAELTSHGYGFGNDSEKVKSYERQLNRFFEDVRSGSIFETYYNRGFTQEYFKNFSSIICDLPAIGSPKIDVTKQLSLRAGYKAFIYPSKLMHGWKQKKEVVTQSPKGFWTTLTKSLLDHNIVPIVWHGPECHDISPDFGEKCVYCLGDTATMLATMRATGCVVDILSGISRLAITARAPFIYCTERNRHYESKENEIDDLCCSKLPHQYIFSIATMIESGQWLDLSNIIANRIELFIPSLNRDEWPPTSEISSIVPYSLVRQKKKKRIGTKFIKVPKTQP